MLRFSLFFFFSPFCRIMPRLPSEVWKHFTETKKDGKDVFLCKYCSQQYVKNATKMQNHLQKCKKFPQTLRKGKKTQQQLVGFSNAPASVSSEAEHVSSAGPSGAESPSLSPTASTSASGSLASSSQRSFYFDSIDNETQHKIDESLARAIYASGSPLSLTSNVYWQRCFKVMRPAYTPPTRHALDTHLLEAEYVRVQDRVNSTTKNADCGSYFWWMVEHSRWRNNKLHYFHTWTSVLTRALTLRTRDTHLNTLQKSW